MKIKYETKNKTEMISWTSSIEMIVTVRQSVKVRSATNLVLQKKKNEKIRLFLHYINLMR